MNAMTTAKEYFQLSNQGDLRTIESMLEERATYSSDAQGLFFGRSDIMAMMRPFFESYRELNWVIESAKELTQNIVEIEFSFSGVDSAGVAVERKGLERIVVDESGIRHIEVRT